MRIGIVLLSALLFICSCTPTASEPESEAKRYALKGKVVSVDKAAKTAKVAHEDIPGYMEAMTMDFPVKDDWVWEDLTPGSEIRGELVVDNAAGKYWVEKIGIVAAPSADNPAPPANERFAQVGRDIPDFKLTDQDGNNLRLHDYHGKALAITFIYSECPLTDYCIRMSTIFSDLALDIGVNEKFQDKMRLLSISFDPERDTPEKLRSYGQGYLGNDAKPDFTVWQLAVGTDAEVRKIADFFGLHYEVDPGDKTQFRHSLRTAVIAPDGKVTKIYAGNDWTSNDLFRELKAALPATDRE
ncbi:MAG: SCO family protein [Pyrinomonadaceae bacterium]